ncbi:hypothetical protein HAX54_027461, partial [Datura stramonium]|nr:hypothetical protein [Datura stramonium]
VKIQQIHLDFDDGCSKLKYGKLPAKSVCWSFVPRWILVALNNMPYCLDRKIKFGRHKIVDFRDSNVQRRRFGRGLDDA